MAQSDSSLKLLQLPFCSA
uniref:Uncharacterized protein n=1 Tax=Rhizophora mucronata TaxID=61149 RepID=A0A2P2M7X6_RHIMU